MRSYNRLSGADAAWAKDHRWARGEYCHRVSGANLVRGNCSIANLAGDGSHGFAAKTMPENPVSMTKGTQGQDVKKKKTVVKPRKNTCRVCTTREQVSRDSVADGERQTLQVRAVRRSKRNNAARRGQRKSRGS